MWLYYSAEFSPGPACNYLLSIPTYILILPPNKKVDFFHTLLDTLGLQNFKYSGLLCISSLLHIYTVLQRHWRQRDKLFCLCDALLLRLPQDHVSFSGQVTTTKNHVCVLYKQQKVHAAFWYIKTGLYSRGRC